MAEYLERRAFTDIDTAVHHVVGVPPCCPASGNPLPGSTIRASYRPRGVVFPVEALADLVAEYVGGHNEVREMEGMIQHIASRVSQLVGVRVRCRADLVIRPPFGGDNQGMIVTAIGNPV